MAYSIEYNFSDYDPNYQIDYRELAHKLNNTYGQWQPVNRMEKTIFMGVEEYMAMKLRGEDVNGHVKEVLMNHMSNDIMKYLSEHVGTTPVFDLIVNVPQEDIRYYENNSAIIRDDKVRFTLTVTYLAMCSPLPKIEFDFDKGYFKHL